MWWFKPKPAICMECGVYYDPAAGYNGRCSSCGKAHREYDNRKASVMHWAECRWQMLETQMKEEQAKAQVDHNEHMRRAQNAYAQSSAYNQLHGMNGTGLSGVSGIGGFNG